MVAFTPLCAPQPLLQPTTRPVRAAAAATRAPWGAVAAAVAADRASLPLRPLGSCRAPHPLFLSPPFRPLTSCARRTGVSPRVHQAADNGRPPPPPPPSPRQAPLPPLWPPMPAPAAVWGPRRPLRTHLPPTVSSAMEPREKGTFTRYLRPPSYTRQHAYLSQKEYHQQH